MPAYDYRCPQHGLREVTKSRDEAGCSEYCPRAGCGRLMIRIFSRPGLIIRPTGYSLRPEDKGYWNFNRQAELGELRDGEAGDSRRVDQSLFDRPPPPKITYTTQQQREIRNLSEIVDREIRASSDIPELWREGS
jgi:predicted nucleic acid-binding Zn ribbon protein